MAGVGKHYEVNKNSGGTVTGTKTYYPAGGAMRVNSTLYFVLCVEGSPGLCQRRNRFDGNDSRRRPILSLRGNALHDGEYADR